MIGADVLAGQPTDQGVGANPEASRLKLVDQPWNLMEPS
jgi:hypothetical protein